MPENQELALQHQEQLQALSAELLSEHTLILASNRGPVEFTQREDGSFEGTRGTGGLVTAMSAATRFAAPIWIAAAMGAGDRARAHAADDALIDYDDESRYRLRFVQPPADDYELYYNVISNPLLWFLQHSMWDAPRTPNITPHEWQAWGAYERVNQLFADAIAREVTRAEHPALIMLHDYHLYLVAGQLRDKIGSDSLVSLFVHIPWPGSDYLALLPHVMRDSILRSCCSLDVIGFHTSRFRRNFLNTCRAYLPEADVDYDALTVTLDGHTVHAHVYPISLDVQALQQQAEESQAVRDHRFRLRGHAGDQTIVRVDRIEPSKNIVRGFQSFELLLKEHPELHGRVKFLAILVPSRLGVDEYSRYLEEIMVTVGWINTRYGTGEWQPVELFVGDDYERAIAAMQLYDVLLVNPIIDGMNLVAKEGPTVNSLGGVLVISEGAGAIEQLQHAALTVSPTDIVGTANALYQALTMPLEQRYHYANTLKRSIAEHDIAMWLYEQFEDFRSLLTHRKQDAQRAQDDEHLASRNA
jgi:trehalose 6-phosphate synthase